MVVVVPTTLKSSPTVTSVPNCPVVLTTKTLIVAVLPTVKLLPTAASIKLILLTSNTSAVTVPPTVKLTPIVADAFTPREFNVAAPVVSMVVNLPVLAVALPIGVFCSPPSAVTEVPK